MYLCAVGRENASQVGRVGLGVINRQPRLNKRQGVFYVDFVRDMIHTYKQTPYKLLVGAVQMAALLFSAYVVVGWPYSRI
jgi:hypothetical protein